MPIKRNIFKIGHSKGITLPKSWIDLLEEKYGPIKAVTIEVDETLKVAPITKKAEK